MKKLALIALSCFMLAGILAAPAMAAPDLNKDIIMQSDISSNDFLEGYEPYNVMMDSASAWAPDALQYSTDASSYADVYILFEFDAPVTIDTIVLRDRGANDQVKAVRIEFDDGSKIEKSGLVCREGYFAETDPDNELAINNVIDFAPKSVKSVKIFVTEGYRFQDTTWDNYPRPSRFGFERVWILEAAAPTSGGSGGGSAKTADGMMIWAMAGLALVSITGVIITKKAAKATSK